MKVYTRTGDEGFTSLIGGGRARKDDPRVEALGGLDELNSVIGWALCEARRVEHVFISGALEPVQRELFVLGSRMAMLGTGKLPPDLPQAAVDRMERDIDVIWADLEPLTSFIIPGGSELGSRLHVARAVCRRAERAVIHLLNPTAEVVLFDPLAVKYLNRLNDLLFALARLANRDAGENDVLWHTGA